jgi:HEAT repeat protein
MELWIDLMGLLAVIWLLAPIRKHDDERASMEIVQTERPAPTVGRVVLLTVLVAALAAAGCRAAPPIQVEGPDVEQRARFAQAESRLLSADASVRRQAAIGLLSMDYAPALQAVLDNMRNAAAPAVRISMIQAGAFCADHRCFEAILASVKDAVPQVQQAAADALTTFAQPAEVDAMLALIEDSGTAPQQRQLLFRALGRALAIRAVPVLLAGLEDEDPASQAAAWAALRTISRRQIGLDVDAWKEWWAVNSHRTREDVLAEHLRALSQELRFRTAEVTDLADQHEALMRLVGSAHSEAPRMLLEGLTSRHDSVQLYSSFGLAAIEKEKLEGLRIDDKDYDVLKRALTTGAPQVRRNVILFVVQLDSDYRDELVKRALSDEDPEVLTPAVEAVRSSTGPEAIVRVEVLLAESSHAAVRIAAANTLGKVGSERSVNVLKAALDDPEENVRWFAVEGLRKLRATHTVPKISEMLTEDSSPRVRAIAASTLGELGQPAGIPALRKALGDDNERVREKAVAALLALANGNYERMMVIAGALHEGGLLEAAEQVLTRVVEHYGESEGMKSRLAKTYEGLAAVHKGQSDFVAAARAYEKLDELTGGSHDVRRELIGCWVKAGEPAQVVGALEKWLTAAPANEKESLLALTLDSAELLISADRRQEAGEVLDLTAKAAGEDAAPMLTARMGNLRRRLGE